MGTLMVVIVVIVVVVVAAAIRITTVRLAGWFRNGRGSRRSGNRLALVERGIPFPTLVALGRRAVGRRLLARNTARLAVVPIVAGRGALRALRGTRG